MSEGGEKRPFGKKPFGGKKAFGDKKPFGKKPFGKRSFGDKKPFAKKPFSDRPARSDRPLGPPRPLTDEEKQARASEGGGERPFRKRPFADRKFGDRKFGKKPFGEGRPAGFEKKPYEHPAKGEPPATAERPHLQEDELRYLGRNACLALFQNRPQDIIRVYVQRAHAAEFKPLLDFCASNHKSYHQVEAEDLERLTDSVHHQGICVVAKARRFDSEKFFFNQLGAHRTLVLYLDGVGNPHNLGAVLRTAAHFGVHHVCVPAEALSRISPAIYRTAEGAAEVVSIVRVDDPEKFLDRLQSQGFHLYAFEAANSQSVFDTRLNEKSVFVFGAEVEGISGIVRTVVETKLAIPGTGAVESLNVSVAAAIAMAEFNRQGTQRSVRIVKSKP